MEEMEKRAEELADKMKSKAVASKNGAVASKEDEEVADPPQPHMPKFQYDKTKTMDENASDLIELEGSDKALSDDDFIGKIADKKKEQISKSSDLNKDIHLAKKTAEKIEATTKIDGAFYDEWKSVLSWGGIDSPSKKPFMIFMLILILPFFIVDKCIFELPIAIIRSFFGAINGLLEKIKTFGKIARGIAFSILILGIIALIIYLILYFLNRYGVIKLW